MQQVVFLLLIGLVLIQADSLLEMDAHCAEECGSPEYDELVKELDHQDEVLNDLVTRAVNVEHSLDQSKKEHDDADRESRNLLLRLDRLHSDKEHDVCPKKHRKCLTSAARDGKPCVANILVCDGEEDCLDGSDEDPELCRYPMPIGERWYGHYVYYNCTTVEGSDIYEDIITTKLKRSEVLKSKLTVEMAVYWNYLSEEIRHVTRSINYNYAERKALLEEFFLGSFYKTHFFYRDNSLTTVIYKMGSSSVEPCGTIVFTPNADRKPISRKTLKNLLK